MSNRFINVNRRTLKIVGAAILFIAALFLVLKLMIAIEDRSKNQIEIDPEVYDQADDNYELEDRDMIYYNGGWYVLRNDVRNVLLIGIDKNEDFVAEDNTYRNHQQADFLFLLVFDDRNKTVKAIHLNRDTMVEMNTYNNDGDRLGSTIAQLALSHTYGVERADSCENTVDAVQGMLYDTPIERYISFTMDTVPIVNDYYGGVTVHLDEDFTWLNPEMEKGTDYTLFGEEAIKYIRARMNVGDGTNLSRMKRHREYINALLERTKDPANSGKDPMDLVSKLSDYVVSNCTVNELSDYKKKVDEYELLGIDVIDGEAVQGPVFIEFYPNEKELQELIFSTFYDRIEN